MGYGDYQIGNVTISRVYYVEGPDGVDLLTGSRENNLYTLSLQDMMVSSPIFLLSKASKTKSWLWHRRLSHLNFGAINHLARQGLVRGLSKLKFKKHHLSSACAMGKSMKKSHKPKSKDTNQEKLDLLHIDLYGPMRVKFLRSKDEALDFIIKFLRMIQVRLKVPVGISHETSVARSPQQNGVIERHNRTLIEAARIVLIYAQAPLFLWAEAMATACFTQNRSIIRFRHGKTPYELLHNKLPNLSFFYVFGALCYPRNDIIPQEVEEDNLDIEVAHIGNDPLLDVPITEVTSAQSSSTGRGLQGTLEVEDTHVTLTPIKPDGQQESSSVSSEFMTSMLNLTLDVGMESIFETTSQIDVQTPTSVVPLPITTPTMTSSSIATTTPTSQAPTLPTTISNDIIQNLPSFGLLFCFDDRLRSLEEHFSEVTQTNQFTGAVSAISGIVQHYMDQRMNEAMQVVIQIKSDWLREEAQRENDEFLKPIDENIKKIIKEQVKEQVKAQVSKILPRIEQAVNEQLKAEVLTRSSHSSRTSYVVAADLSEMELKKILIEKIEGNKSIQRSDEQRNLYKALVDTYESDKIILDTYGETVTLKRRRDDDEHKDEEPSAGPYRGSKRRREGKEPESASAPSETATKSAGRSTTGSKSRQASASKFAFAEEPLQTTSHMEEPSHPEFETCAKDQPIIQSSQHPEWFSQPQKPPTPCRD
nr:hypothetical protein [Tanacetum cinerariifolium]